MAVEIRRVTEDDVAAVAAVQVASALAGFAHIFPAEAPKPTEAAMASDWQRRLFDPGPHGQVGFLAIVEAEPVGVVVAGPAPGRAGEGHIARLYVRPEQWGRGVGRSLYDAAVTHLASQRFRRARLQVLEGNRRARSWYERLGWHATGERDEVYEEYGVVEIVYARDLDAARSVASG